jgi:phospholipase A-2-activating protein
MAVAAAANGDVLSTSVDGTARVWRDGQCAQVLSGHEGSVLCVLPLPDGSVLTGGSDKVPPARCPALVSAPIPLHIAP